MNNGIIYLKRRDLIDELKGIKNANIYEISKYFKEDFFETKKIVYISY